MAKAQTLTVGAHPSASTGMCAMEAVSCAAGETWSDSPLCACPVIAAFLRAWNDGLPDGERDALLLPLIHRLVDTRDRPMEHTRALMAADWLIRVQTVAWLQLADAVEAAETLSRLPQILSPDQAATVLRAVEVARLDAAAARDRAWFMPASAASRTERAAAWGRISTAPWVIAVTAAAAAAAAAAREATRATALDAVRDAIWATASPRAWARLWNAAVDTANDAAHAGAGVGGRAGLCATREVLQRSATGLVTRMIEAKSNQ